MWLAATELNSLVFARLGPRCPEHVSALALGLTVLRRYEPVRHDFPPVVRAVLHEEGDTVDGITLAGRIFVSWSSTLGAEAHGPSGRLDARLEVGTPDDGTVTSVSP